MNNESIERGINRIGWGARYARVKNGLGREVIVILRSLSLSDRNWVDFIYQSSFDEAIQNGLMTKSDLAYHYQQSGEWTTKEDKVMDGLQSDIDKMQEGIDSGEIEGSNLKRLKKLVQAAREKLNGLIENKYSKFSTSAERYAEEKKVAATIYCVTYKLDETRYWKDWDAFEDEVDQKIIRNLGESYVSARYATQKEIRAIARSPLWRVKWNAGKNCDDLFAKSVLELDAEQEALVYWSQVYDSVYEAYERPSEETINDDEALDAWFEEQSKKKKVEATSKGRLKSTLGISEKIGKHGEIFVVTNKHINPDAPEPNEVWGLNSEGNMKFIHNQQERLKKSGTAREREMRPDYGSRLMSGGARAEYKMSRGKKNVNRLYDY